MASSKSHKPTITTIRRQTGADSTVYVTWKSPAKSVNGYLVEWMYNTGDGVWFPGSSNEVEAGIIVNTYSFPSNARSVLVKVAGLYNDKKKKDWSSSVSLDLKTGRKVTGISTATVNKVTNIKVDLQSGQGDGGRTLFASWSWPTSTYKNTDHYVVTWQYYTAGSGVWFDGTESNVTRTVSTYSAPSNATKVRVKVLPVSKTYKVYSNEFSYWKAQTSSWVTYAFVQTITLDTPSPPTVSVSDKKIKAEISIYGTKATRVEFQVLKNNKNIVYSVKVAPSRNRGSISYSGEASSSYKVRCRLIRTVTRKIWISTKVKTTTEDIYSAWSDYSSEILTTPDAPVKGILRHDVPSINSVWLYWEKVKNATGYDIEYATQSSYFDHGGETSTVSLSTNVDKCFVDGLTAAIKYYFRIRSINDTGTSPWSKNIYSLIIDTKPDIPTTWNEADSIIFGESARLFWIHSSEDGSTQSAYKVQIQIGERSFTKTENNANNDLIIATEDEEYNLSLGDTITWKVKTKGVSQWSEWSAVRSITVYAEPSVELTVLGNGESLYTDSLTSFPIFIQSLAKPSTQTAISWLYSIIAMSDYDITDFDGQIKHISSGNEVFSKLVLSDGTNKHSLVLSAGDIDLENNASYTLKVAVSMSSGITAEASCDFEVAWSNWGDLSEPMAEIGIDEDKLAVYIRPYCSVTFEPITDETEESESQIDPDDLIKTKIDFLIDENHEAILDDQTNIIHSYEFFMMEIPNATVSSDGTISYTVLQNVVLSVFRREYDGSFVVIGSELPNDGVITVMDPHPALNYARYRIVARSLDNGQISFNDLPGIPIGVKDIVIQWDEQWTNFNMVSGMPNWYDEKPWSGSLLRLPYNVQITDTFDHDVATIEYIGRKYPVSYFGTQVGMTSSWKTDIPRDDEETLYAIRRLSAYMGNCYVREPYGTGYLATVKVSYNKTHNSMVVPVTLTITRVEGGA